mmetsp:Transcript_34270/g.102716  ORF Transcript_34270/g.102716 Transcript_34270/m.102716 type:complete len:129 (+) Transcript_34270:3878-4264(+)
MRMSCSQLCLCSGFLLITLFSIPGLYAQHLLTVQMDQDYEEVRRATVARYDAFAAALQQLGLIGIWSQRPLIDGVEMKSEVLRDIPKGPVFRDIMNEQERWMTTHPGGGRDALVKHMRETFPKFVGEE